MTKLLHTFILSSRFLLIPLYFGMTLGIFLFGIKFIHELVHLFKSINSLSESDLVLGVLALIDLMLVANLMIMVIISGYDNFVSPFTDTQRENKPAWLGTLDMGSIKIKVASSLVGISSIHLLAAFLNIKDKTSEQMMWLVITHLVFVVSALLLAYVDKVAGSPRDS